MLLVLLYCYLLLNYVISQFVSLVSTVCVEVSLHQLEVFQLEACLHFECNYFISAALFIIILCFLLLLVGHEDLILLHKVSDLAVHPADHASPGRLERRNKHICYCTVPTYLA